MTSFMVEVWESIFTPGPTAPLLKAANLSFAALQTVLFGLLVATYNVHCVVLSILSAGLWWSINWFAAEVKAAQLREEEEKKQKEKQSGEKQTRRRKKKQEGGQGEAEDSSDTEVESTKIGSGVLGSNNASASAEVEALEQTGELKRRTEGETASPTNGTQSSASTEDEWEKVSQSEHEKDK